MQGWLIGDVRICFIGDVRTYFIGDIQTWFIDDQNASLETNIFTEYIHFLLETNIFVGDQPTSKWFQGCILWFNKSFPQPLSPENHFSPTFSIFFLMITRFSCITLQILQKFAAAGGGGGVDGGRAPLREIIFEIWPLNWVIWCLKRV